MPSPSVQRRRRLPLIAVLIFAACLCLSTAAPSAATALASSPSVSDDSALGDEDFVAESSDSDSDQESDDSDDDDDTEDATNVATDDGVSVTRSQDADSTDDASSEEDDSDDDESDEEDGETVALTPIPTAAVGSKTFALVDSVTCGKDTVDTIESICSINRPMFDACVAKSGYQIFPYSGVVPDADDIANLVNSSSCMGFITAIVLLDMPACTVSQMPLRAVCETLLKISVDIENGESAPDAVEFHKVMSWRRDSDLAKQAGQPYDNGSAISADFMRNLRVALVESKVTLLSNLTILIDDYEGEEIEMADGAEAAFDMSLDDDFGSVKAAGSSTSQQQGAYTSSESIYESVAALSSDATRTSGSVDVSAMVAVVVAAHAVLLTA